MDPRTGQIYALATVPTFDPNKPADAAQADIRNRAVTDAFEPGSTSKVMTMAAVIEEKKADPLTHIVVPPVLVTKYKTFHDDVPHGTLKLTLNGVLARSSNIGTIIAAQKIGGEKLFSYLKKFGIGEPTGLHFPGESKGFVPSPSNWSATSFGTIAFGQGLSLTAVQAASVYATIANDGLRVAPTLVAGYTAPDGTYQAAAAPSTVRVVSPDDRGRGPVDARVGRVRPGHRAQGCHRRLPRRGQDRNRQPHRRRTATATAATPPRSSAWRRPTPRDSSSRSSCRTRATATSAASSRRRCSRRS